MPTFNIAAFLFGSIWAAGRGLYAWAWCFAALEITALIQFGRGLWGDLDAEQRDRIEQLQTVLLRRQEQLDGALNAGGGDIERLEVSIRSLEAAIAEAARQAELLRAEAPLLITVGIVSFVAARVFAGLVANWALERRFAQWHGQRSIPSGFSVLRTLFAAALIVPVTVVTVYHFTVSAPPSVIVDLPFDKSVQTAVANALDDAFQWLTTEAAFVFDGIANAIRAILDMLEVALVETPWPVVYVLIVLLALQVAGYRIAILTAAGLFLLLLFGFWKQSMATIALLGSAASICVIFGIPLGILCAKSNRAYQIMRPILDFMQTMPAFVYLIPVIALFGIGKPPAIIASVFYGMPPLIRLTRLGIVQIPPSIEEASRAFGATPLQRLLKVELPLAKPSIMTGINQAILISLSLVVIASLIGAKGLGQEVLQALQFAATGQGILAGFAILICALILDRIVQGRSK
ncbi:MAG: ABC transporter permease subunit [Pseudomonadota bacterium]